MYSQTSSAITCSSSRDARRADTECKSPWLIRPGLLLSGLVALFGLSACGGVDDDTPSGVLDIQPIEWQLVFEDDFDGDSLDESKWNIEEGNGCPDLCGWGNNEQQIYSEDNITVADGILTIQGREEADGTFTSARINTKGKFDFRYGKVEVKARLPAGQGTWPAIWMLHSDPTIYGPWPLSGEIDIMEAFNLGVDDNNSIRSSTHYGLPTQPPEGTTAAYDPAGFSPDMTSYVYTMEWERDKIRFYVDGEHWQSQKGSEWYVYYPAAEAGLFETDLYDEYSPYQVGTLDSPFDQLFHLIINLAVGGNPVGDPDPSIFPQNLEVDYVRVYECANANPDTGRGCGTADASVVPLSDNDGNALEELTTGTPYREDLPLFTDGPETLSITVGDQTSTNTLQVGGFVGEGASLINDPAFVDPDDPENIIWHVAVTGGVANAYLESEDKSDDPILETGFDFSGNRLGNLGGYPVGEVAFDMLVDGIEEGTDLVFKLQSDDPANRGEAILPQSELVIGEWKSYSVKFDMFLANPFPDGSGVDLENVLLPFVIEVQNGSADVYLDNIRATNACQVVGACGVDLKSTLPDVVVFDDAVNTAVFSRGIVGWDGTTGADYTDGDDPNKKVNWREIESDDAERGQIIEVTFNDQPGVASVWFIGSTGTDLSAYNAGAVEFDIKVDDYGGADGITFKIDCFFPCTSGDKALGKVGDGAWETVSYPVARLAPPLELDKVNTGIVLFPTNGETVTFELDNIRWVGQAGDIPLDQIDLPVTFDDPLVDYTLTDFGGASSAVGDDPTGVDNNVAVTTKTEGSEVWAGTTIGTAAGFANPIPFTPTSTSMSVDVRVPVAGIPVRLKIETLDCPSDGSDTSCFAELDASPTMADEWETLTWDFSLVGIDTTMTFQKASIFFDFGTAGDGSVYYWDNVRFGAPPPPAEDIELVNGGFETGDFTGWTITAGDNLVGAPVVGARSGAFAAQLTTPGGSTVDNIVPEIRQSSAANPGDEINLSAWLLTEAALPEGASFGLVKIVFKDAAGNDLVPASASIGVINAEFPGIESQPFLDAASPVDTWVFSEAQGIAPEGTVEVVFLLLNVDFAGGENPIWFDDAQASLVTDSGLLSNGGFEDGDLTGWTDTAGTNTVGAPGAGARTGSFAAQLTTPGGSTVDNIVPEIRQIFAANPGDEVNFSAWLLTEAALPEGASFGLAKIVFKDAAGNDLVPASASIGVINAEFPGIESEPFLDSTSPVGIWVFSQAQGVAPAGTVEVQFLLLNIDYAGGENPIWFDDSQASFIGGEVPLDQIDLPVTFDDPMVDYTVQDFGDPVSASTMLGEDPDDAGNTVAMTTKPTGAPLWAGTTIGNPDFANPIPFTPTETLMSVDVRVPMAGIPVRLKVETTDCPSDGSDVTCFAETEAFPTMNDAWETLTWDFSLVGIDTTKTFVKASIFFDFGTEGNDAVYLWDNVRFGGDAPPPEGIELVNSDFETGDFAGWTVNAGDNTVGVPGVGAQSGAFAAQLTAPGGNGVAEIRQTFAANPGDEVNFSAWMLTEAALPAGPSFGLAKIVFTDAGGNALEPASVSIGQFGPPENPGIESLPFLNDVSTANTWVFSEAQGVAPEGTVEVSFLLLNVDFAGGENPIWFDNAQASLVTGESGLANGDFETGDFAGWTVNAGDNTVGVPGVGAQSGAFAAQLTAPGGNGVAEIRQTFAANPGDEVNFSAWMLTEAALPAGPSFGLAKIVFTDAGGNALEPASVSIGQFGPPENPGIESLPFLNDVSTANTWVFSEAQGVAPEGTVEVSFLLLNVDFAGGENPIWFDNAQASLVTGESGLANGDFETGDLTGWENAAGDNTVGAPAAGAQSGASAAQLTTAGGGGVAEIRQIFAANPGDEINFSTWLLTEAAIPEGASFGLAKIVFKDAAGNDLVPESASIGVINFEFPGIESVPIVDATTPVDTWVFSEAQGVAPEGTVEVRFLLLNIDFAGGENPIWFDNAQASTIGTQPPGGLDQIDLPVTFDDPMVDYTVQDFGDPVSASTMLGEDPDDAGNTVAMTTKPTGAPLWAGTTIGNPDFANPIPFTPTETLMSVDVRVPMAGIPVRLKVETADCPSDGSDVTCFAELDAFPTMNDAWETLTWDFGLVGIDTTKTFMRASIFFDFGTDGNDAVYLWDNVRFGGDAMPPDGIALANDSFETGDFTGWTVNGADSLVGAPVVGARSGAFAAQLTTTGGGGVTEIRQTFAANPGDEINLSAWLLTEAALPEGASFGLVKIVFKDAGGNDLLPESASVGVINTDFPGIESQPFLNNASAVDAWVFSQAQGVAPAGTAEVAFLLLNVDFAGGENPVWVDDAQAVLVNNVLSNEGFETGDFTDWTVAGDNLVGTPVIGARSGAFAAQLTTTGGGGVPEIRQSVAANPGDEINLSAWLLTEAALPEGASFGLVKIVFKDAGGNDLLPESASVGVINTDFPGIESQPFLNNASAVDAWVFSQAQGVAPAGTVEVAFLLLNVDFAGGENPIWFDDAQAIFVGAGP